MKKILILLIALSITTFAVDMSIDTVKNIKVDEDKTKSKNKSKDIKNSSTKRNSTTKTRDESESTTKSLTKIEQTDFLELIMQYEENGVQPFVQCQLLSNPKLLVDFKITSKVDGFIDNHKASLLKSSAENNENIKTVGADELAVKDYINCGAFYGALIAQAMKTGVFDIEVTDREISRTYKRVKRTIAKFDCRFDNELKQINCGASKLIIGYMPEVFFSHISLLSNNTYYGYSANEVVSIAQSKKLAYEISKAKENAISNNLSTTSSRTWKYNQGKDKAAKTNFSARNWIKFD